MKSRPGGFLGFPLLLYLARTSSPLLMALLVNDSGGFPGGLGTGGLGGLPGDPGGLGGLPGDPGGFPDLGDLVGLPGDPGGFPDFLSDFCTPATLIHAGFS